MTALPKYPFHRRPRRASTTEWLELLATDGPFLAAPVAKDAWPNGLPALDRDAVARLRDASSLVDASPGSRDAFVRHVLSDFLGWHGNLATGDVPLTLTTAVPEHHTFVRPDLALLDESSDRPRLLGLITDPGVRAADKPRAGAGGTWNASAADRLAHALRAQRVPLGLITDGTEWTLVCAPQGGATATATWTRHTWFDEPDTLKAFHALLGRLRFFGIPDSQTLPALLAISLERQEEITERLSEQSQAVVEMLVATIGRLDAEHRAHYGGALLPPDVRPSDVYEAAVTVLMRLVFLLYAEERGLLPLDDDTYADSYAASTLAPQLRQRANDTGEDTLERSSAGWHRLLATFRAVHRGSRHEQLTLPGYGGSLFDPDRFPWLEGRGNREAALHSHEPLRIDDRTLLRALEELQWLRFAGERRRVSFHVLDVEQIGYVYEGLLDQDARRAEHWVLGIAGDNRGEKNGPEVPLLQLQEHLALGVDHFADWLSPLTKSGASKRSPAAIRKSLIPATGAAGDIAWTGVLEACGGDEGVAKAIMPFAGLLRRDPRDLPVIYPPGSLYLTDSELRADTGAIYTPRLLAEEVVKNALEPLVYAPGPLDTEDKGLWKIRTPEEILDLKVIDIAAGSGAFLVGATRYLADQLLEAQNLHCAGINGGPKGDEQRIIDARRSILDHCIYGVDINPMAIEMAKLSLWLITLDRHRPFGFLDDRLAVGDSLLGLTATEQLRELHFEPGVGRRLYREVELWTVDTPALLKQAAGLRQQIADVDLIDGYDAEHKARLLRQARVVTKQLTILANALSGASLAGGEDHQYRRVGALAEIATQGGTVSLRDDAWSQLHESGRFALTDARGDVRCPAHFPLLFPEVFSDMRTGFDAILGNPPFLGGQKLTVAFGVPYREHLVRDIGKGMRGSADLVAYMFLTAAALCDRDRGQLGLIATNTVAQGDTRHVGLDQIVADGHAIYRAVKSAKWPTQGANLEYSIVWASRRRPHPDAWANADGTLVRGITPGLDAAGRITGNPCRLAANARIAFQGSNILGMGFTMSEQEAQVLIKQDPRNADVLFPYVNGEDLNSRPDSSASRWVINFRDWSEERAKQYPDCYAIVRDKVKPERDRNKDKQRREIWWRFTRPAVNLLKAIEGMPAVFAIALTSKVPLPVQIPTGQVFSHTTVVFASEDAALFALLSSSAQYAWAILQGSTLETRLRFTLSDVFETLPLPSFNERMRAAGTVLGSDRRQFMLERQFGLTTTYNLVHDPACADVEIKRLRELHVEVDQAVCDAYGWNDLLLAHGHYETRQGVRWTLSPMAQVELLDRLLELNHLRYADEQKQGPVPVARSRRGKAAKRDDNDDQVSLLIEETE
jgi:hypothetical protein